jgi:hypothetical protein
MPVLTLNPYLWLMAALVLIGFGFYAASGHGSWGKR